MIEFIIKSKNSLYDLFIGIFYGLIFTFVGAAIGPREAYICGLFPLNVADLCMKLFQEPDKEVE